MWWEWFVLSCCNLFVLFYFFSCGLSCMGVYCHLQWKCWGPDPINKSGVMQVSVFGSSIKIFNFSEMQNNSSCGLYICRFEPYSFSQKLSWHNLIEFPCTSCFIIRRWRIFLIKCVWVWRLCLNNTWIYCLLVSQPVLSVTQADGEQNWNFLFFEK